MKIKMIDQLLMNSNTIEKHGQCGHSCSCDVVAVLRIPLNLLYCSRSYGCRPQFRTMLNTSMCLIKNG